MSRVHTPVLLRQVIEYLDPTPSKRFIDATLGAAGHTLALLEHGADVVGIDRDQDILALATQNIAAAGYSAHFHPVHANFAAALAPDSSYLDGVYDGILFDLGVSSLQLDTPARGFSFRFDAPLDMRMDRALKVTAADLINGLGKKELFTLLTSLGQERHSKKIVAKIIETRKIKPLKTTTDLVKLIESVVPSHKSARLHPATRVFQALRMAVNTEREELKAALPSALSWLSRGGVLAVISFHSLEHQIVQEFLQNYLTSGELKDLADGEVTPTASEIKANHRARSAVLRVMRKQ